MIYKKNMSTVVSSQQSNFAIAVKYFSKVIRLKKKKKKRQIYF